MSLRRAVTATVTARFVALACAVAALAGCGGSSASSTGDASRTTVTVSAAASLTDVFRTLGREFEASRADVRVRLNVGGSSGLAEQIKAGAPVDVFASASTATMRPVVDAGRADGTPAVLARNVLQIAVPQGNPAGVTRLADLARPGVKVAVCAPKVPCGEAASAVLAAAGVTVRPVTREQDVRAVLTKVRLGEVDAGLVYRTDVRASARDVTGIDIPGAERSANDYLVVVVRGGPATEPARAFVDYVRGERGRAALSAAGFVLP